MNVVNSLFSETSQDFDDKGADPGNHAGSEVNPEANPELNPKIQADTGLNSKFNSPAAPHRYLMTQIGQQQLAFPLQWVAELILVEQSHILTLPFYDPMLFGVLQYKGDVVPLVVAPLASKAETAAAAQRLRMKRTLTAVRLNRTVGKLAGVALMVDRVIERFASATQTELAPQVQVFQLEDIPSAIWQPR